MATSLSEDAIAIWSAGVAAVDSARLVQEHVRRRGQDLEIGGGTFPLSQIDRIVVVGGGKAGAGMAAGLEQALGADLVEQRLSGWLNVPADCVRTLLKIHLHAGRPAGVNEPTSEGVVGTERILELVSTLTPPDLCIVLLSGGGSALLPAPVDGITLTDKQIVTRQLMEAGATIDQLNAVRSCLSRFKGGGLLRAMPGGRGIGLIISDVIGDPLAVIASGPTVDAAPNAAAALRILQNFVLPEAVPANVLRVLRTQAESVAGTHRSMPIAFRNMIIGNNQTAVLAAARQAEKLGYSVGRQSTDERGIAREVGQALADELLDWRRRPAPGRGWCLISGGEPVVQLVATSQPRSGGRNQELVLAAAERLWSHDLNGITVLSGGTDGEDGPTDAAGAFFDAQVRQVATAQGLNPQPFLAINNSYPFFDAAGGLLRTGPTHTNVMDLRIALVNPR